MLLRLSVLLAASLPLMAIAPARPGTLNYLEGDASLGGSALTSKSVGKAELVTGQVLQTESGKAEVLLIPGTFLRLGANSAVRMISPGLTDTQFEVLRGKALVEVTGLKKENNLRAFSDGAQIALVKKGLYEIDGDQDRVRVFDGKAVVTEDDHKVEFGKGKSVQLNAPLEVKKFDRDSAKDDLYNWSKVRSEYLSEASAQTARVYVSQPGFFGSGWYWNPYYGMYSYLPGDPFMTSPFGFGFYSPRYYWGAPTYFYRSPYRSPRIYSRPRVYSSPRGTSIPRSGGMRMGGGRSRR